MREDTTVGIAGRFQPFHWGHFEYVLEASLLGGKLRIGITNPFPSRVRVSAADLQRSSEKNNPFTFQQRREMILQTLSDYCPTVDAEVVPCDLRSPRLLRDSLGDCDIAALTIYDEWGREKLGLFEQAGYSVEVLWQRTEKLVTGTEVRNRLAEGRQWQHLVPAGTARVLGRPDGASWTGERDVNWSE